MVSEGKRGREKESVEDRARKGGRERREGERREEGRERVTVKRRGRKAQRENKKGRKRKK